MSIISSNLLIEHIELLFFRSTRERERESEFRMSSSQLLFGALRKRFMMSHARESEREIRHYATETAVDSIGIDLL